MGKTLGERLTLSLAALNAANRRYLPVNSATFGGTHHAEPRQEYLRLRSRFHY
jgi:outer membrane receptor protein involved in Fe transport